MGREAGPRYILVPGAQVREEKFGLLFYIMQGPRLYFLSSGRLLDSRFFQGELSLDQWIERHTGRDLVPRSRMLGLKKALKRLKEKGVLLEC